LKKTVIQFVNEICPRPDHFCDGHFIKDRADKQNDIGVCQYYNIDKGCTHPNHPTTHNYPKQKV
jgi:Ni,Fe-hydrogenase I small subunit